MTGFDYEKAMCDNPGTSYFLTRLLVTGWMSLTHLLALGADDAPVPDQFPPGNILHSSYFSPGMCTGCMSRCPNQYPPASAAEAGQCECGQHFSLGHRREGSSCPCASLAPSGAGRAPKAHLETPPAQDDRVTLRLGLVHSLAETSWV